MELLLRLVAGRKADVQVPPKVQPESSTPEQYEYPTVVRKNY